MTEHNDMFSQDQQTLASQIEALAAEFAVLATHLRETAEVLEAIGTPPPQELSDEILAARRHFQSLDERARNYAVQSDVQAPSAESLNQIKSLLNQVAAVHTNRAVQDARAHALTLLERIESISPIDGNAPPALEDARRRAAELKQLFLTTPIGENNLQIQAFLDGQHPLISLVVFVEQRDSLDDETWSRLELDIAENFGKALAVAAARGRLGTGVPPPPDTRADLQTLEPPPLEEIVSSPPASGATSLGADLVVTLKEEPQEKPDSTEDSESTTELQVVPLEEPLPPLSIAVQPQAKPEEKIEQFDTTADVTISRADEKLVTQSTTSIPLPAVAIEPESYQSKFDRTTSAEIIAQFAISADGDERATVVRDLVWRLIPDERYGLAFQLNRALWFVCPDATPSFPEWLIAIAAFSTYVQYDAGEMAHSYRSQLESYIPEFFANGKTDWHKGMNLLLAGATLQPALFAPTTGAAAILRDLPSQSGLEKFYQYCQEIADYGEQLQGLDLFAFQEVKDHAAWETKREKLRRDTQAWYEQAKAKTVVYAPATKIWRKWLEPGQHIHTLLEPIVANNPDLLPAARNEMERLLYDADIRRELNYTDRKVLHRKGPDITAAALAQIQRHTHEAIDFLEQWIALRKDPPAQSKGFLQEQAERLRSAILAKQQSVTSELASFHDHSLSLPVTAGARECLRAVKRIELLFSANEPSPPASTEIKFLFGGELLKVAGLSLNDQLEPDNYSKVDVLGLLLDYLAAGQPDWQTAFDRRVKTRDHEATARIIEYLQSNPQPGININALSQARAKNIQECQDALRRDLEETAKQIEAAVALGLLRETERADLSGVTESIRLEIPRILRFDYAHARLAEQRERIQKNRNAEIQQARRRLENLVPQPVPSDDERIKLALQRGDVLTANEYMDMVADHRPLPTAADLPDPFSDFFPTKLQALYDYLEHSRPDLTSVVDGIRKYAKREIERYSIGPIPLPRMGGPHMVQAADMLEAWLTLKRTGKFTKPEVAHILEGIGFRPRDIVLEKRDRRIWGEIKTELIADRTRCPIAAFGSDAKGNYRLLFALNRPNEEDLISDVGETTRNHPMVVLYLGRMTIQRRRDLARICWERRRTFIAIDDALILYLCGERDSRLPVMFQCALPFTFAEPYTSTAGLVPPEMFYGRVQERRSILDPYGSCFIYGGRQLGKTALLRDIERNSDNPEKGKHVLWIDLKTEGIGYDRTPDALWSKLMSVFKLRGIIPESLPANTKEDTMLQHAENWMEADQQRSILLLLDEADRFLESDGKEEFVRTARIKGLMDRTDRRFKVVFAGLHNVQRTTRQENNPLAHYGDPIRIGPLLDNGEWREARSLIEQPLRALGFRFESPDLATRILSQTNYYPSLIQLYCRALLKHISSSHRVKFDPNASPPYIITSRHVEDAYLDQELRSAIRHRFMLTLDLDPRYRLIAFAIALYSVEPVAAPANDGFSVSWIREQALLWWSEGFRESTSEEIFRTLLEEMVGLGVLRVTSTGKYALRSPNILSLLGTQQEIENELESSQKLEPPPEYDSATFRMTLRSDEQTEDARRSPLTAQQEAVLHSETHGVSIIFGTEAGGLKDLAVFLKASFGNEFFIPLEMTTDEETFSAHLSGLTTRTLDGTTLMLVPAEANWNAEWIQKALERVERLTSKRSFVRIAFVADPAITWRLTILPGNMIAPQVTTFSLQPWNDAALRQWLLDHNIPVKKEGRERITQVTGNWPLLLEQFYERVRRDPDQWEAALQQLDSAFIDPRVIASLVRALGLDNPLRRRILRDLAILGEASVEDLSGVVDGVSAEMVKPVIDWADRLSLVRLVSDKLWRVQPLVESVLKLHGE